jgi:disulfide bond formation protein DsbB
VAGGQLVAVCGVLAGSLTYQFVLGELPCPLCVVQRMAFLLACVGPTGILLGAAEGRSDRALQGRAFGMTILASLVGAAASIRQISLHIVLLILVTARQSLGCTSIPGRFSSSDF